MLLNTMVERNTVNATLFMAGTASRLITPRRWHR